MPGERLSSILSVPGPASLSFGVGRTSKMLRCVFIGWALALCGCTELQPALNLAHDVDVPQHYRAGNFSEEHPGFFEGNSTVERYVSAYERGWWIAVQNYANDINFCDPSALAMNGWPEEALGGNGTELVCNFRGLKLLAFPNSGHFVENSLDGHSLQFG